MPEIPDASQREQALDIARSFIVEAPAGSGKTGLLIQRYLKLLASESVTDPAQVLAITFTRKATSEMQERVLGQLTDAHAGTPPTNAFDEATRVLALAVLARDAELDWQLIKSPRLLRIRTIDSVATDIARSLPILSGSGGGQTPAEDSGILYAEAAQRTLMLLGGSDPELSASLETLLLHRDGHLGNCRSLIAQMLTVRDQWGELVPLAASELTDHFLDTQVLPRIERALDQAICRAMTHLTNVMPSSTLTSLCALAAEMGHLEGYDGNSSPIALCANHHLPPPEETAHLEHWRALVGLLLTRDNGFRSSSPQGLNKKTLAFAIEKHHRAELVRILDDIRDDLNVHEALCAIRSLPPAQYPAEQWHVTKALFRVLARALVELQLVFAARNQCDFAEVGLLARAALRRDSALDDLQTSAGVRLQHLLVDEMQDTSSAQYELIQLLTRRWDGYSQTVFLVGDPKQSIYLFRQARVERFVRTMRLARLGDLPLTPLHLTANFRSQRTLVTHFNDDFAQLFPASPDPLRPELVPFRSAQAMREATTARARQWHAQALPYSKDAAERSVLRIARSREHAEIVAEVTSRWRENPHATIAVLVRNRTHLLDIVKGFRAAEIPYRAVEIEPLGERQEILDLLALTRALLHSADRTAWLAILRAPWCGLSLADLHALAGEDDPALARTNFVELIEARGEHLSPDGIERLQPFWLVMQAALARRGTLSLTTLVARTWHAFAAPLTLAQEALTNTGRYFALLDSLEQQAGASAISVEILAQRLDRLYAAPATTPGAVDLMTIHKAKGLEWDVVFVPALERTGRVTTGRLLAWLEIDAGVADDVAHGILAPIQARGEKSHQLATWMRSIEAAREAAERKRLFYVACTRAREELHLFAAPALNVKGEIKPKPDSLLHAAWPAASAHVQLPVETPQPAASTVLPFPAPLLVDLAATGEATTPGLASETRIVETPAPRLIERIPAILLPQTSAYATPVPPASRFQRPQGSFAARAFGNTMHAFLEQLSTRRAAGATIARLQAELPINLARITAVLRAGGLSPQALPALASQVLRGLVNTLADPAGQWLLDAHPAAQSEATLASPEATLRLDRTFLAGDSPGTFGASHLWVIDYKTGSHGETNAQQFLEREKEKYRSQLEAYAHAQTHRGLPLRVALYYPMLPALVWWEPMAPA